MRRSRGRRRFPHHKVLRPAIVSSVFFSPSGSAQTVLGKCPGS